MIANKNWNKGRNISKCNVQEENKEVIELYDKAVATNDWDEYTVFMIQKLEKLIIKRIYSNFKLDDKKVDIKNNKKYEDLMANGNLAIVANIKRYNPRQAMPSSFFSILIDQYLKEECHRNSDMSDHYIQMSIKLTKVAQKYGYVDALDPELSPEKLAKLSGESLKTIANTLEQMRITKFSLDDPDNNVSVVSESFRSPEQVFMENEKNSIIKRAFSSLSEYEQFLLYEMVINVGEHGNGTSLRTLVAFFKSEENRKAFGLDFTPDSNRLQNDMERVLRTLKHQKEIQEHFAHRQRISVREYSVVEQAPMDFIESAICEDVESFAKLG